MARCAVKTERMRDEALDERCRQWLAARQCDPTHTRQLTARIVQEACRRRRLGNAVLGRFAGGGLMRVAACAVATATVALVAVLVWRAHPPEAGVPGAVNPGGAPWAAISESEATDDRQLFGELQRLFSERLRWVAEFNGDVSVGVDELPGGTDSTARRLAVRLVVVARGAADATWRPLWRGDILLREDERIALGADRRDVDRLTLWAHTLPDGKIAVEADMHLDAPVRITSVTDTVLVDGIPTEVACLHSGGSEYRVLQSVKML